MSFIKTSGHELHQQTKEIKSQLTEQIKCLEQRTDTQVNILNEINEFVKKRAEIELEYSKQLEKLTKSFMIKHKNEKPRRANWSQFSTCTILQQMVDDTKLEAYQRGISAQIYGSNVTQSINTRAALLQKISKKCREIGVQAQGELIRVLNELQVSMKAYQMCYVDFISVKDKLHNAELSKQKSVDTNSLRKQKSLQKAFDKRLTKFEASQVKCNRARNEYLLCIEAANAAMHKFFAHDLSDLIDCADISLDSWVNAILTNIIAARKAVCQQEMTALASLSTIRESFQLAVDRHKFFESNSSAFMLPKAFEFRHDPKENVNHIVVNGCLADDLRIRQRQINKRLDTLKKESDELALELDRQEEHICNLLSAATIVEITKDGILDGRPPREVTDESIEEASVVYTDRFRHHLLNGNLIIRLEARAFTIGNALKTNPLEVVAESPRTVLSPTALQSPQSNDIDWFQRQRRKKRVGSATDPATQNIFGPRRPRLFGGSLTDYVEVTGEEIPIVVTSCIRVLSHFALHHQGVFRISGSQVEINNMKEAFENGDDPLANSADASDVNSIAGVLKLYLRELREPLFPVYLFEQLTECAKCSSTQDFITQITPLLNKLPRPTYLLLRYLFAFLNHLSQFSDENMMDPFNLAICFGPTLLPIPEDKDQVYYQASVNDVVKNLIEYHDSIFNPNISGPIYRIYEDGLAYADDGDECFTPGIPGSEAGTVRHEDARLMTISLHSSIHPQNGVPGMDRRLANAAAAVANNRRSFYEVSASSNGGILSPSMNVTSYEEGDERMMLPMRTIMTPPSQSGFNSLITPLSTNSSTGRTSLSGDSTVSSLTTATTQKEEINEEATQRNQSLPQKINPSKSGKVLQERSSIDSGIGAAAKDSQQKSPASSDSSEQSKKFELKRLK
jgi:SLIT-ROBO Rho GTPase activating protein